MNTKGISILPRSTAFGRSDATRLPFETGGAVRPGSIYIKRRQEDVLSETLRNEPEFVSVIAPRQTGKTSLINHLANEFTKDRLLFSAFDLRVAVGMPDGTNDDAEKWVRQLLEAIWAERQRQIGSNESSTFSSWWNDRRDHNRVKVFCEFFTEFLFDRPVGGTKKAIIVLDELDMVHQHGAYTDILFAGLRHLYPKRGEHEISFVLSGINPPHLLIKALERSNFSVGERIALTDFTEPVLYEQYFPHVARAIPNPSRVREVVETVVEQTGGQPYLTNVLLSRCLEKRLLTSEQIRIESKDFVDAVKVRREAEPHFDAPLDILRHHPSDALDCLRAIEALTQNSLFEAEIGGEVLAVLRTAGLVRNVGSKIHLKSPIYREFFDQIWIDQARRSLNRVQRPQVTRPHVKTDRRKLLIINCGGTIGMELQLSSGELGRPADLNSFFRRFPEIYEIGDIDPIAFSSKDGINFSPENWKELAEVIYLNLTQGYAGIVICMGTDSLSYAAAAISFALCGYVDRPIVFTGAQVPNHLEHSDAGQNLLRSCLIAAEGKIREVCVVYGDSVFRGVRAEKKDDYRFDGFHSPTYYPLAVITEKIEYRHDSSSWRNKARRTKKFRNEFATRIFKWSYVPGVPADLFKPILSTAPQGIVMQTPGVGNVPTEGKADVLDLIEQATRRNIPVLITSLYPSRPENISSYRPAKAPIDRGAMSGGAMAEPAAIVKFMWLIAQVEREIASGRLKESDKIGQIRARMMRDEVGELTV